MMQNGDHDITVLNSLITTTIDSANGFERSAENVNGSRFEQIFSEFARKRRQLVGQLQQEVRALGGTPEDDGSMKADLHRRFEDLRSVFGGGDKAIVEEVERGEDYIKDKYETALNDDQLSPQTRTVIQTAYTSVKAGHDRARDLKHSLQGA